MLLGSRAPPGAPKGGPPGIPGNPRPTELNDPVVVEGDIPLVVGVSVEVVGPVVTVDGTANPGEAFCEPPCRF